jgi:hypothetical protein
MSLRVPLRGLESVAFPHDGHERRAVVSNATRSFYRCKPRVSTVRNRVLPAGGAPGLRASPGARPPARRHGRPGRLPQAYQ